jgi:anthranilate phosphoribosyltransferase
VSGANLGEVLDRLCAGQDLSKDESAQLFGRIVKGELSAIEISALLIALKAKGERPAEIAGAAGALRAAALPFDRPIGVVADTCGTGGDGQHTVNVSTAAAFVAADLGVRVAKHGNRSVSSRCGSADVLEACGVRIDAPPAVSARCLTEINTCFLMAPQYHQGIGHAMPVRRTLKTRTIFNLLGPLVNPAAPSHQVVGVYAPEYCVPLAETLGLLGCEQALVVHGSGLDELALHGPTTVARLVDGEVKLLEFQPEGAGLPRHPISALAGGLPEENAAWLQEVLAGGAEEAHRAAICFNAGALAWIAGLATGVEEGVAMALEAVAKGGPAQRLKDLARLSQEDGPA